MNKKIEKPKSRRPKKKLLKNELSQEEADYQQFELAAERLISALKLSIVKIKSDSEKGILLNNEMEENITENGTTGTPEESTHNKQMELEMSTSSPTPIPNDINLSFQPSLNNINLNDSLIKSVKINESISKNEDESSFMSKNKFIIEDNLNERENNENEYGFGNFFNFFLCPNNNFSYEENNFMNNLNYEQDDMNMVFY